MEEHFGENYNKIEISRDSNSVPKFEDIVDIKKYNNSINEISSTKNETNIIPPKKKLKFCCKKIGHTLCIFSDKMGNPLIMIGPDWPLYLFLCGGVTAGYICFLIFFWKVFNIFMKIIGISSFSFFYFSYTVTFLLNPGYPERNEESIVGKPRIKYKYCDYCDIWERVDMKIAHCFDCGVCIERHDHHCPWTGKCIGRKNIYYFKMFLASILVVFLFFVIALVYIDINNDK
jgi:hypothetical protein